VIPEIKNFLKKPGDLVAFRSRFMYKDVCGRHFPKSHAQKSRCKEIAMSAIFELSKSKNDKFYFNLKASNGSIILTSEMYEAKASAIQGIESVKTNSGQDGQYDRKTSTNGKPYFNLKAANGEVIGASEMYESEVSRDHGIESVKANAAGAAVVDQTK
jgi:uncharacterized protein YegP (UPF0339 family)